MKKNKNIFTIIVVFILVGVCCFSGYKLFSTLFEYKESRDEYTKLQEHTEKSNKEYKVIEAENVENTVGEIAKDGPPIEVDWDELMNINADIVGWIHIDSIDISYPIVKGEDNDYYLHRTVNRTYNFSGSIFMEHQNENNFSSLNTIL